MLQVVDGATFFRLAAQYQSGKCGLRLPAANPKHSYEPSNLDDLAKGSWMVRYLQHLCKLKADGSLEVHPAINIYYYIERTGRQATVKAGSTITYYEAVEVRNDKLCPAYIVNSDEL